MGTGRKWPGKLLESAFPQAGDSARYSIYQSCPGMGKGVCHAGGGIFHRGRPCEDGSDRLSV